MRNASLLVALSGLVVGSVAGYFARAECCVEPEPTRSALPVGAAQTDRSAPSVKVAKGSTERRANDGPVEVAGLLVQRTLRRASEFGDVPAFFGTSESMRLALELDLSRVPAARGKKIVDLLVDRSTLTRFADDLDTDLTSESEFGGGPYEHSPNVSADGLGLCATIATNGRPHENASSIVAEGELAVLCASERATRTSASARLVEGAKLEVQPYSFVVTSVGPSDFDPNEWCLDLTTTDALDAVIEWALVTETGEVVALRESMTWTMNDRVQKTLVAPRAIEQAALRLELWADSAEILVPYRVEASLGLR